MTREELLKILRKHHNKDWPEADHDSPDDWHIEADQALLAYIDDQEITEAFDKIEKWYS